jgi:hypothetical protein
MLLSYQYIKNLLLKPTKNLYSLNAARSLSSELGLGLSEPGCEWNIPHMLPSYCTKAAGSKKNVIFGLLLKFLQGTYKDTVFKYGKVKFKEENEQMYLLFAYDVLESVVDKPRKLEKDTDFKNYLGDLLVELMSNNVEQEIVDETGTDDIKEPDL